MAVRAETRESNRSPESSPQKETKGELVFFPLVYYVLLSSFLFYSLHLSFEKKVISERNSYNRIRMFVTLLSFAAYIV
jgi:hypothetical protein